MIRYRSFAHLRLKQKAPIRLLLSVSYYKYGVDGAGSIPLKTGYFEKSWKKGNSNSYKSVDLKLYMAIGVFIVDDHYMVIEGIRSLLQNEKSIEWMGHATNGTSCLAFLQQKQPDVLLMDINLPDRNGIELCKEVKEKYPSVFIIGLSTFNQQSFVQKMMENGASGYVLKNATQAELMEGITMVASGKTYLSFEAGQSLQN